MSALLRRAHRAAALADRRRLARGRGRRHLALPAVGEGEGSALGGLVPEDAEPLAVERRSLDLFDVPLVSRALVVQRDPQGLPLDVQARVVRRALRAGRHEIPSVRDVALALPVTNAAGLFPSSRERGTTAITYLFFAPGMSIASRDRAVQRYAQLVEWPEGALVGRTGAVPGRAAEARAIFDALPMLSVATAALVAAVFGLAFCSPAAPLIALLATGLAWVLSERLAGAGARRWASRHPKSCGR